MGGEQAGGDPHAGDILRKGLPSDENHRTTRRCRIDRCGGVEDESPRRSARRCCRPGCQRRREMMRSEVGVEHPVELLRVYSQHRLGLGEQTLIDHVDR